MEVTLTNAMTEYTVKVKFTTASVGKRPGEVKGQSCTGEVYITVDGPFDTTNTTDPELIKGCKQVLAANPGIKGRILSLDILGIMEKAQ